MARAKWRRAGGGKVRKARLQGGTPRFIHLVAPDSVVGTVASVVDRAWRPPWTNLGTQVLYNALGILLGVRGGHGVGGSPEHLTVPCQQGATNSSRFSLLIIS